MNADGLKDAPKDVKFPVNSQQNLRRILTFLYSCFN